MSPTTPIACGAPSYSQARRYIPPRRRMRQCGSRKPSSRPNEAAWGEPGSRSEASRIRPNASQSSSVAGAMITLQACPTFGGSRNSGAPLGGSLDDHHEVATLELLDRTDHDPTHRPGDRRRDRSLHLHGLDRRDRLARLDPLALLDRGRDGARERGRDVAGPRQVRLLRDGRLDLDRTVAHLERAQLAVEGEHDRAHAALVRATHGLEPDDELDALVELDLELLVVAHAVQVALRVEHRDVPELLAHPLELLRGPGEQQVVEPRTARRRVGLEVTLVLRREGRDARSRAAAGERLRAERLGPTARRVAELSAEEADHRVRDVEALRVLRELLRVPPGRDEVEGEVTDDLRRRRDLDEAPEDAVRRGVHRLDLLEAVAEAERDRLLTQVRQLSAGDLVLVHAAGRPRQARLERGVDRSHGLPVRLEIGHGPQVEARVTLGELEGRDEGGHRDLARRARKGGARGVDRVDARRARREERRELPARGVVRVQVDRQV